MIAACMEVCHVEIIQCIECVADWWMELCFRSGPEPEVHVQREEPCRYRNLMWSFLKFNDFNVPVLHRTDLICASLCSRNVKVDRMVPVPIAPPPRQVITSLNNRETLDEEKETFAKVCVPNDLFCPLFWCHSIPGSFVTLLFIFIYVVISPKCENDSHLLTQA